MSSTKNVNSFSAPRSWSLPRWREWRSNEKSVWRWTKIIKNTIRPRRWLWCTPFRANTKHGTEISAAPTPAWGYHLLPKSQYSCLSTCRITSRLLLNVDLVEDQFLPPDCFVERLFDRPPRRQKLHLFPPVLHEEVLLELLGVEELLYEALGVVLCDYVFDSRVFYKVNANP